jgi:hypothetical protein
VGQLRPCRQCLFWAEGASAPRRDTCPAGGATAAEPFFYSYVYPEPEGYRSANIAHGRFDEAFGEYVLPYSEVQASDDPAMMLSEFFDSAYKAGANLAHWDRPALEREPVAP